MTRCSKRYFKRNAMELILLFVILGFGYSAFYVVKGFVSAPDSSKDSPVLNDGFPSIDLLEPAEENKQPAMPETVSTLPAMRKTAQERGSKRTVQEKQRRTTAGGPSAVQAEGNGEKRKENIKFSNKSEAKRAIIYHEIFNRKYQ